MKKSLIALIMAVGIAVGVVAQAHAAQLIVPTNFDGVALGTLVTPVLTGDFMTPDLSSQGGPTSFDIGNLSSSVYFNAATSVYTYRFAVLPQITGAHEVNTGFAVQGFNPAVHKAGFSFSDSAGAAGGASNPNTAFTILYENDFTLDYNVRTSHILANYWATPERLVEIDFFFQSSLGPVTGKAYNLMNGEVGTAVDLYGPGAAVPEPSSLVLLGTGLVGAGLWARRKLTARSAGN